jgi:hypothetical protein
MSKKLPMTEKVNVAPEAVLPFVPITVRNYSAKNKINRDIVGLLTDERAKNVWAELRKHAIKDPHDFKRFIARERPDKVDDANFVANETLLYIFAFLDGIFQSPLPMTRSEVEADVDRFRTTAEVLSELRATYLSGGPGGDDMTAAIDKVRGYVELSTRIREHAFEEFIIERRSKERGNDDLVRVRGRQVALLFHRTFGQYLYGTAATVINIMTGSDVDGAQIQKWCPKGSQ